MRIFIGILLVAAGFLLNWKTEAVVQFTGYNDWAEQHLGAEGGTRLLTKFIGIVFIFFGMLAITNLYKGFLESTIGALFGSRM